MTDDDPGGSERGKGGSGWWKIDHFPRVLEGRKLRWSGMKRIEV